MMDKIEEVLEDFNVWCMCGSRECQKSVNFEGAKAALASLIAEERRGAKLDGAIETLESQLKSWLKHPNSMTAALVADNYKHLEKLKALKKGTHE